MNPDHLKTSDVDQLHDQMIHALLLQQLDSEEAIDEHIERVLQKIDEQDAYRRRKRQSTRWIARPLIKLGLAASVLICFSLFFVSLPSRVAMASIQNIASRFETMGDRSYSLTVDKLKMEQAAKAVTPKDRELKDGKTKDGKTKDGKPKDRKPRITKGKLFLRGGVQFVLMADREDGSRFIKGQNLHSSWQVTGEGTKFELLEPDTIKLPLSGNMRSWVFYDLKTMLEALPGDYDLVLSEHEVVTGLDGTWSKIEANQKDRNQKGVKQLSLFFNPDTFDLQRVIYDRVHFPGDRARVSMTFDLFSNETLPPPFFDGQFHVLP